MRPKVMEIIKHNNGILVGISGLVAFIKFHGMPSMIGQHLFS